MNGTKFVVQIEERKLPDNKQVNSLHRFNWPRFWICTQPRCTFHPSLPLVPHFPDTTVHSTPADSIEMNSSHLFIKSVRRQCSKGTDVYPLVASSEAPLRQTLKEQTPRASTVCFWETVGGRTSACSHHKYRK